MIPFERDDGKAFRLAAIHRASRAPLSQRRWESHQPQEEPHSRYLPHLQATQQNPASPSRRNPASSELLGGEVLVPFQRRGRGLRDAGALSRRRRGSGRVGSGPVRSCPGTVGTAAPAGSSAALPGEDGGVRGSAHRQMLRAGVLAACPHLPLSGCSQTGGGGAFLPLPRRLRRGDSDALTEHLSESAGELRRLHRGDDGRLWAGSTAPAGLWAHGGWKEKALSFWRCGPRLGRSRGHVQGGTRDPSSHGSRISRRSSRLRLGALDAQPSG